MGGRTIRALSTILLVGFIVFGQDSAWACSWIVEEPTVALLEERGGIIEGIVVDIGPEQERPVDLGESGFPVREKEVRVRVTQTMGVETGAFVTARANVMGSDACGYEPGTLVEGRRVAMWGDTRGLPSQASIYDYLPLPGAPPAVGHGVAEFVVRPGPGDGSVGRWPFWALLLTGAAVGLVVVLGYRAPGRWTGRHLDGGRRDTTDR